MRAIRRDDRSRVHAFHSRLSCETIYLRYFAVLPALPEKMVERLTQVDYENRMVLVATTTFGDEEAIIAAVQYDRSAATSGEVAFVVQDGWQGLGIGTALLQHLAEYAHSCGIETLTAITMASNQRMLSLLRHSGFPLEWSHTGDELDAELDITQLPTATKCMQAVLGC
jgi:GNAT superfamily N-acetyltransferase